MPMVRELLSIGQNSGYPNLLKSFSPLFSFRIAALPQELLKRESQPKQFSASRFR